MKRLLGPVVAAALALPALASGPAPAVVAQAPAAAPRSAKKRAGPPEVPPVVVGKLRYEALLGGKARGLGQNGGDLLVRDAASGAELYTLRVYELSYKPGMEGDKQDVFITDLALDAEGRGLLVTDERGRRWRVDLVSRRSTPVP